MELQFVESSMIQAFGYDEDNETLLVIFNSGKTYQ
ncbi:MAG: KTSC domain-containing protein [Cyanobacteria bacterium J06559_3]